MKENIDKLNLRLKFALNNEHIPIGLSYGKMGLCIYFFQLARTENNKEYNKIAEKLLDQIFNQASKTPSIDIENGLLGISLGISFLIRNNYVQGSENAVLKDIDDEIFKQISFNHINGDTSVLIQTLYYIYVRKLSALSNESEFFFNELTIHIINELHSKVGSILMEDAVRFSLDTKLPLFLFVLSKIYQLNIYNYKIINILREITPFILSKYEYLDSQRLYLLWGISRINLFIKDERLAEHCNLLVSHIDVNKLIGEFRNKSVFLKDGIGGIYLLMLSLEEDRKQVLNVKYFQEKAKEKMENSLIWDMLNDTKYLEGNIGLFGYCGVSMILKKANIYEG